MLRLFKRDKNTATPIKAMKSLPNLDPFISDNVPYSRMITPIWMDKHFP